jgi:DegV family protein with EDD domain
MVRIITDTTACLQPETVLKYQIPVIPQVIHFGNDSYLEGVDMDTAAFLERLQSAPELPKTSAPPPELFIKEFEKLVPLGDPILCIHPSSEVSGTVRSAQVAAGEFPGADIRIIDTRVIASPLASMVELAAGWAGEGMDADKIEMRVHAMIPCCRIYFLVSTLEYLAKGGRIGGATALLGSVLRIKPILTFIEGRVDTFDKERTQNHALSRLKNLAVRQVSGTNAYLTVMHAGVPEQGQALAEDLKAKLGLSEVPIHHMPPAIVTHGGPGILGVGFFLN